MSSTDVDAALIAPFDYGNLPAADAKALEEHAAMVRSRQGGIVENMLIIGEELKAAQRLLANNKTGVFNKWIAERCGFTRQSAYKAIAAYNAFGYCKPELQYQFDVSSLYLLSADCCPEPATKKALRLAEKGERITKKRAKELIEAHTIAPEPFAPHPSACVTDLDDLAGEQFGCIYADPPWQYGNQSTRAATDNHYQTMTVDELCEMPVEDLADDAAHLHLWTTNGFLPDAFRVIQAWGFEYKSCFVWVKDQMGIGNYWRVSHEFLLLGVRGDAKRFNVHDKMSWLKTERTTHSAKPEKVSQMIEEVSPGPFLELFGRRPVRGWTVFGNQIENRLFI
jgi:N6-adenosine-specific RNA methylase IME4